MNVPKKISGLGSIGYSITLEDIYAGMAMQGILANPELNFDFDTVIAESQAYGNALAESRYAKRHDATTNTNTDGERI